MWKEVLDFDLHAQNRSTPVRELIAGAVFHRPTGGAVGVANVGMDANWLGNPMALANLYGFGRLAWNPKLTPAAIVDEWTRLTFGSNPAVVQTVTQMQLSSWHTYESYTGPLGVGTMTNILGSHYGPGPDSSERNGWGQWHRADRTHIGMDRTMATGTGFIGQYAPAVQRVYETLDCPDNLLLFFHHVPYMHKLHSGTSVIQFFYNSHYEGAQQAEQYVTQWQGLRGLIDDKRYREILARLEYQAGHALVWRDAICNWLYRLTGIADDQGRVGHYPNRVEAEDMLLRGYVNFDVTPWESASNGKAVECPIRSESCKASFSFNGQAGWYQLGVQYFDANNGTSQFAVYVNDQLVDSWWADLRLPTTKADGDSSTRHRISGLRLHPRDQIRIQGTPEGEEPAALDYVEVRGWSE